MTFAPQPNMDDKQRFVVMIDDKGHICL